jgi:NAD(P)H-quinone oxidoreductase subunit 5
MGFMLMEVGLGLYELALLHLVAHSLYKAYAFLSAGDTVDFARDNDFFAGATSRSLYWYATTFALSAAVVMGSTALWQSLLPSLHLSVAAAAIVALGLAPLMWLEQGTSGALLARGVVRIAALTQLYLLWHVIFAGLAPVATETTLAMTLWVMMSFTALYAIQIWLRRHPQGRLAQTLYPWAYCGFYLDETFTRLTFKFWPARLSPIQAQTLANKKPATLGEAA